MRRIVLGALAALTALTIGTPAQAVPATARPDLRVSAQLEVLNPGPPRIGGSVLVTVTVTNTGRGTAGDVRATLAESHNINWRSFNPELTALPPFVLAPGAAKTWELYGNFDNESDVEGWAGAKYRFATTGERHQADNAARVGSAVEFAAVPTKLVAYSGNKTLRGVGVSFVYTRDGVEKVWRTVRTCDDGTITVDVPGGVYTLRFHAPEGYQIREGWNDREARLDPHVVYSLENVAVDPVVSDPPLPSSSTDPECAGVTAALG